jgi:hypothetical protein
MPEAVANPPSLFAPSARPATEVGWQRAALDDRGLVRLGAAVNAMLGSHFGMLIHDNMSPAELPLTPSDPLDVAAVHRRWMVKTPSYLNISESRNRRCTLQVRVAKGAGAGLNYRVYVGGTLATTYTFGAGGLSEQWVTLSASLQLDDTVDYQEVRIERDGWHGGSASTDYCRAVRLYPNVWPEIFDQNDGWRFLQVPVPVSVFGVNDSAASWLLQSIQTNLRWLYERRVSTLYGSTGLLDASAVTTIAPWTKLRLDPPRDVTQVRFWFYAWGPPVAATIQVDGYGIEFGIGNVKSPDPPGWVSITCDVSPRGSPLFTLSTRETIIYSVCAYCQDASYGGG